jgi:hypothetical protein
MLARLLHGFSNKCPSSIICLRGEIDGKMQMLQIRRDALRTEARDWRQQLTAKQVFSVAA